jgi:hypothetical protein
MTDHEQGLSTPPLRRAMTEEFITDLHAALPALFEVVGPPPAN